MLRRYGLADWLTRFKLPFSDVPRDADGEPLAGVAWPERIRMAATELGPTFIKFGQLLASRPDLVGIELADELKRLRADVRPEPFDSIDQTLRAELGETYADDFDTIDPEPLACASIGQVHRGYLRDGTPVVLKIQRRGIGQIVREDIDILSGLAPMVAMIEPMAAWSPVETVEQLAPIIRRELDFESERQNLVRMRDAFDQTDVEIPEPIDRFCTANVLVMREVRGQSLADWLSADPSAEARERFGERLASAYLAMVFDHALFHADPHPGNIMVTADDGLGLLDFGMVGRIDSGLRELIEDIFAAIIDGDERRLGRLVRRAGRTPPDIDEPRLAADVSEFVGTYGRQSLGDFRLDAALNDLSAMLHRHQIQLPHQSALLLKMLVTIEGTMGELGVRFDSLNVATKYIRRSMMSRYSPRRRLRDVTRLYREGERFLELAPDELLTLATQLRRGELGVSLNLKRLSPSINRLVLGLMCSAVFLGSSMLLAMQVPPVLASGPTIASSDGVSIPGVLGLFASMAVMGWLMLAIVRSGQLTKSDD